MYASQIIILSAVFIASAMGQYSRALVTINKDYEPYWYQKKFGGKTNGAIVDGDLIQEIKAYTLTFTNQVQIKEILNFQLVKEIYLDMNGVWKIPVFRNLPAIEKISLSDNEIKTIQHEVTHLPVKELVFSSNKITNITDGAFGSNVQLVYLTCNNLTTMSPKWFTNPANLTWLNMGGNQFTTIPDDMFKDFVNLGHLELRNNQLKTLGAGSLSGPTKMSTLHLGYNMIADINANVIGNKLSVTKMDVQYNRLSFLREGLMDKLNVSDLRIWANPWQCPCRDLIFNWIDKNNNKLPSGVARDEDPNCVYALSFKQSCVPFVDEELYHTFLQNFEIFPVQFCKVP